MGKELLQGWNHGQAFLSEEELMVRSYTYLTNTLQKLKDKINGTLKSTFHFEFEGDGPPTGGAYVRRMDMVEDLLLYRELLEKVLKRRGYLRESMRAKTVNETLLEFEFERGQDPKAAIGIGKKHLWKEFRSKFSAENRYGPDIDEIEKAGFTLDQVWLFDPLYIKEKWGELGNAISLMKGNYRMSPELKQHIDENFANLIQGLNPESNYQEKNNVRVGESLNSLVELKNLLPKTAEEIKKNPVYFIDVDLPDKYWPPEKFGLSIYNKFFNPFDHSADEIRDSFGHEIGPKFKVLFKDFPDYYKFFRKNADTESIIEIGKDKPELLNDLVKKKYALENDKKGNELDYLLGMIEYNEDPKAGDFAAQLVSNYVNNTPKIGKGKDKKIRKIIKKNMDSDKLKKYFSAYLPELAASSTKMAERSSEEFEADYKAAEDLLKKNPLVTITTTDRQYKNGTLEYQIAAPSFYSKAVKYGIAKSGYLRKMPPTSSQFGVAHYDPYSTYLEMAKRGLDIIKKDHEKYGK